MPPDRGDRFKHFVARKTREAAAASIERLSTILDRRDERDLAGIANAWTRRHYGGDFGLVTPAAHETALSLVFVQSSDRNTGTPDPGSLGGGATDKHLIYEGLSYSGAIPPALEVITKKAWFDDGASIVFEHVLINTPLSTRR